MFDAEKVKNECTAWIRDFFEKNGPGCNAVVGISGGKDSSVVAALCVEALGRDRVIGVLMPCGEQSDLDKAQRFMGGRGAWMGFFAFLPIIGSAITILLGLMRANIPISLLSIAIGKILRYWLLVYGVSLVI